MSHKSSGINLPTIISLFGLALLGFFTFLGAMFFYSGSVGPAMAIAAGAVVITWLILNAAVYCKTVDTDFHKWKKLEIAAVVLFFLFAIVPARYVIHAFEIMGEKEQLTSAAKADVATLNGLFNSYETFERNALATTRAGLENALGQPADEATLAYLNSAALSSESDIDSWIATQRALLLGSRGTDGFSYLSFQSNVDSIANDWLDRVNSWDVMFLATHSGDIAAITPKIVEELSASSARGKLPVIEFVDGVYTTSRPTQALILQEPPLGFNSAVNSFSGSGPLYYIIYLVIIVLIFCSYLMAGRSSKLDVTRQKSGLKGTSL